ncbi:hypothetical protein [Vibrio crassostreae]|uniref:hypothetical protein n=1 Tax=Vibrio crassostreae TaxID=246167 RepID=UPI001B30C599|nr:hypothetical protein [Vibrio crassostreae]
MDIKQLKETVINEVRNDSDFANELVAVLMPYIVERLAVSTEKSRVGIEAMGFAEFDLVTDAEVALNSEEDAALLQANVDRGVKAVAEALTKRWSKLSSVEKGETKRSDFVQLGKNKAAVYLECVLSGLDTKYANQSEIVGSVANAIIIDFNAYLSTECIAINALLAAWEDAIAKAYERGSKNG